MRIVSRHRMADGIGKFRSGRSEHDLNVTPAEELDKLWYLMRRELTTTVRTFFTH